MASEPPPAKRVRTERKESKRARSVPSERDVPTTAGAARSQLVRAVDAHGRRLNADAGDAKKHADAQRLCLERMARPVLLDMLGFADIRDRAQVAALNHALHALLPSAPVAQWSRTLRLGARDETWFMRAKAMGSPLLPDLDRLERLDVVVEHGHDDIRDVPWVLVHSLGARTSVTDLTLRYEMKVALGLQRSFPPWPAQESDLRNWPKLTALRLFVDNADEAHKFPIVWLHQSVLGALALRPRAPPLRVLRVHTTELRYDGLETNLQRLQGRIAAMFAGLQELGLRVRRLGKSRKWWQLLTAACPRLEKLVLSSEQRSDVGDAAWVVAAAGWPRMRHLSVSVPRESEPQLTHAGLLAMAKHWPALEVLRVVKSRFALDSFPLTAETQAAFAQCLRAWPALRVVDLKWFPIWLQSEHLDALDEKCPHLHRFQVGAARGPKEWKAEQLSVDRVARFYARHAGLRDFPQATGIDRGLGHYQAAVNRCPGIRNWFDWDTTEVDAVEALRYWRQLETLELARMESVSHGGLFAAIPPRTRPLREITLEVEGHVQIADDDLDAIATTCADLEGFHVYQDSKALQASMAPTTPAYARSETDVTPAQLIRMLRRCPRLRELELFCAPLAKIVELTDDAPHVGDLHTLDSLHRPLKCTLAFRLGPMRDKTTAWAEWLARRTTPVDDVPGVREYYHRIRPPRDPPEAGEFESSDDED